MIEEALALAARGWAVLPCHWIVEGACSCGRAECPSVGKHPRPKRGSRDASRDEARVRAWWGTWPLANVGVATGQASRLYVVDLDGPAGLAAWMALELAYGDAPTLSARTGGGGRHLYYAVPGSARLPNTAKQLAPAIDTRGEGGYVLAPPSTHASGRRYEWLGGEVAQAPPWLERLVVAPRRASDAVRAPALRQEVDDEVARRILDEEALTVSAAGEGTRNDQLFRSTLAAGQLAFGGEMRVEAVAEAMRAAAAACGLEAREAEATILSALHAARESPRRIRTRLEGAA